MGKIINNQIDLMNEGTNTKAKKQLNTTQKDISPMEMVQTSSPNTILVFSQATENKKVNPNEKKVESDKE